MVTPGKTAEIRLLVAAIADPEKVGDFWQNALSSVSYRSARLETRGLTGSVLLESRASEEPKCRQFLHDLFRSGMLYSSSENRLDQYANMHKIQQLFRTNTWRSWRTAGLPGGLRTWSWIQDTLKENNGPTLAWIAGPAGARWRSTRAVAQLLANLGASFVVDSQVFRPLGASGYYHPDYRTDFPMGDNPYRYYRW